MLAKPLIFSLLFLLTVVNFMIMLLPFGLAVFPLLSFFQFDATEHGDSIILIAVCLVSTLMMLFLLFDTIFGITVKRFTKGALPFERLGALEGRDDILHAFELLKRKFNSPKVKLLVDPDMDSINAYAVGSFKRKRVVLTMGLIHFLATRADSYHHFIEAVRGIIGHEMSHLVNKDYLPALLMIANDAATRMLSKLLWLFFVGFVRLFNTIPGIGYHLAGGMVMLYNGFSMIISAFFKMILMPVYNFCKRFLSRRIELRCDRQSAYAFGGQAIARALGLFGKSCYFSLFSTHPKNKIRIKKVKNIAARAGMISATWPDRLANFAALITILSIWAASCLIVTENLGALQQWEASLPQIEGFSIVDPVRNASVWLAEMVKSFME